MKTWKGLVLGTGLLVAGGLAWGYWYSATHAYLNATVYDEARQGSTTYGQVHGASFEFLDADGKLLAPGRSVEPWGYVLAQHPRFGDCTPVEGRGGEAYGK